jgi:hypothetical protein
MASNIAFLLFKWHYPIFLAYAFFDILKMSLFERHKSYNGVFWIKKLLYVSHETLEFL